MLLFSISGLTLNNASLIDASPKVATRQAQLPPALLDQLKTAPAHPKHALVPPPVAQWLDSELGAQVADRASEWSPDELYVSLPRAGGDAWLSIDLADGAVAYERPDSGRIA